MAQQETVRSRSWIYALVAVVVVAAFVVYYKSTRSEVSVATAQVEFHDIVTTVATNGKVEPENDFQAHSPSPGVVEQIYVNVNDKVHAGQSLIKMDDSEARKEVAAAQANVETSNASLNAMKQGGTQDERLTAGADLQTAQTQVQQDTLALNSLKKLQAQGAASANEVSLAQQRLTDAQARVTQLQTRRSGRYAGDDIRAQQAQLAQSHATLEAAQNAYSNVDIHAPFAGTVYSISVSQYDYVPAGDILLDVADLTKLRVRAYFDEPEIGNLRVGEQVKIAWDAKPNQLWHGHIVEAPTTIITYGNRNVGQCLIAVEDANGDLLPNTNVTVTVTTSQKTKVLSLPREALHPEGTNNYVYKISDGRLVKTAVQVGIVNQTRFEIVGGLSEHETVAVGATPEADLTDGLRVKAQHAR